MPFTSGQISQGFAAQQSMFGGQMAYAQQLSHPMQAALSPGMQAPPPPSAISGFMNAQPAGFGMAGEQIAASGMSGASMAGGIGMAGMQMYGMMGGGGAMGMAGRALDPFTYMSGAAQAGSRMGGSMGMGMMGRGAMGAAFGGAAALPIYGIYKAAEVYGGAFAGGMQEQAGMNQMLRSNFRHFGGGGAFGRGFSQQQMGQIGQDVQQSVRSDPYMSMGQATSLIGQGAQGGMFTGVSSASEFTQKFRQMLDTLKGVQKELGGSLTEAMTFINEAKQSGIFQTADRLRMAAGQRTTAAVTGLSGMQQAQLTEFGSRLSRSIGGRASQGAFGAQRSMQTIGAAVQSGAINEAAIFEATGESGAEGQMALTQMMMTDTARLTRRAHGRYSIFGLSNEEGTGLDPVQMARAAAGDMGVGELSRRAHRNVNRMGRARAMNQEGQLRGAALEQGGIGFQLSQIRQSIGDRALNQGDDLASLVIQRRMGVDRPRAELYMSMLRNQSSIARQESLGRVGAARQMGSQQQLEERGLDATLDQLGNTMSNRLGVTRTREVGQKAMTRISSLVERALNDALGIVDHQMSGGTASAMSAASIGRASQQQMSRINMLAAASAAEPGRGGGGDPFARGMGELPVWMGGRRTQGEALESFGFNVSGFGSGDQRGVAESSILEHAIVGTAGLAGQLYAQRQVPMTAVQREQASVRASMAMQGQVTGADAAAMERLAGGGAETSLAITRASMLARGARSISGREGANLFEFMGAEFQGAGEGAQSNRLGLTAIMARQGTVGREGLTDPSGMRGGEGILSGAMVGRDISRLMGGGGTAGLLGAAVRIGDVLGGGTGGLETIAALTGEGSASDYSRGIDYVARGGILRRGQTDEMRRLIQGSSPGSEAFEAAYADETIGGLVDEITSASARGDAEAVQRGIQDLNRHGNTLDGPQLAAVQHIVTQMQAETIEYGGKVGRHHAANRVSNEERKAFIQESQASGRAMTGIGMGIQGDSVAAKNLRNRLSSIGELQMTMGAQGKGYQNLATLTQEMIMMSDEDAQEHLALLGGSEIRGTGAEAVAARAQRDAQVGEVTRGRALQRDLTGGGRRGRQQARETSFNMITGGGLGDMEFTDARGRRIQGRRLERQLAMALGGGGNMSQEERTRLRTSLTEQMQAQGQSGAEDLVEELSSGLREDAGEGRGTLSREEAERLRGVARDEGGDLDRVRKNRMEEAQRRLAAADPLSAQRNETLTHILEAIRANKDKEPTEEGASDKGTAH